MDEIREKIARIFNYDQLTLDNSLVGMKQDLALAKEICKTDLLGFLQSSTADLRRKAVLKTLYKQKKHGVVDFHPEPDVALLLQCFELTEKNDAPLENIHKSKFDDAQKEFLVHISRDNYLAKEYREIVSEILKIIDKEYNQANLYIIKNFLDKGYRILYRQAIDQLVEYLRNISKPDEGSSSEDNTSTSKKGVPTTSKQELKSYHLGLLLHAFFGSLKGGLNEASEYPDLFAKSYLSILAKEPDVGIHLVSSSLDNMERKKIQIFFNGATKKINQKKKLHPTINKIKDKITPNVKLDIQSNSSSKELKKEFKSIYNWLKKTKKPTSFFNHIVKDNKYWLFDVEKYDESIGIILKEFPSILDSKIESQFQFLRSDLNDHFS